MSSKSKGGGNDKPRDSEGVGYGKPPKNAQFKKGESGNRFGRPKGSRNLKTIARKHLDRRVVVREEGVRRKVQQREAVFMTTLARALQKGGKDADRIFDLIREMDDELEGRSAYQLSANEAEALEAYNKRLRSQWEQEQSMKPDTDEPGSDEDPKEED